MNTTKNFLQYVDLNIGSVSSLLTTPPLVIARPHGMARLNLITPAGLGDRYFAAGISGFQIGPVEIMADRQESGKRFFSAFDHALETAAPHCYKVLLEDSDIVLECTPGSFCGCFRFEIPAQSTPAVRLKVNGEAAAVSANQRSVSGKGIVGKSDDSEGIFAYFYAEFSEDFASVDMSEETEKSQTAECLFTTSNAAKRIDLKVAVSYISEEMAYKNFQSEEQITFEKCAEESENIWNGLLGKIEVEGEDSKKRSFYTALCRSFLRMVDITESDGRYYSAFDRQVHVCGGRHFYTIDNMWDTYRSMHPLQLLLEPSRQGEMVDSYIRMYEQGGVLPQFPGIEGEQPVMLGNHTAAMALDTYAKGVRNFELSGIYEAAKYNALHETMLPWVNGQNCELDEFYHKNGYYPALQEGEEETVQEVHQRERRQAVTVTLEHSYDDWCIAQMAGELGYKEDYRFFMERSRNYTNLYNAQTGFMSPKSADGKWVENFNPKFGGGAGGRDYFAECNALIFSFHVQHDINHLIELAGGERQFEEKLDNLFADVFCGHKFSFLSQFPDSTGLVGQFCMGNEPAFHIPYLYNYVNAPWKTQKILRQIMDVWFQDTPTGLCGDEDNGAMSSWYVFSAMGFYPVCPGKNRYDMGTPLFSNIKIHLENGRQLEIIAENVSAVNKYIREIRINGQKSTKPYFDFSDIKDGGTIVLEMAERPQKQKTKKQ